jgi:hypothetical protein
MPSHSLVSQNDKVIKGLPEFAPALIYRESIRDLCPLPEFQVMIPSLFLGGVTLFLN